eukprot:759772_1
MSGSNLLSASAQNLMAIASQQIQTQQTLSQSVNSNLMPIQSNTNLMNSTEIRAKVNTEQKEKEKEKENDELIIHDIKLEFNKNDFIGFNSPSQLMFEHNINPTGSDYKHRGRTKSAHSGLIQSDFSHHHLPKLKSRKSTDIIMDDTYAVRLRPNILNSNSVGDIHYVRSSPLISQLSNSNNNINNKKKNEMKMKMHMKKRQTEKKLINMENKNELDELLVDGYIR